MPSELKPCPFCGGTGRLSAKDHLWGGWNGCGKYRKEYIIRVICNKCHARGGTAVTGWVHTEWSCRNSFFTNQEDKTAFVNAQEKAIEAWNRRADNG